MIDDVVLAIQEAMTNAVVHSGSGEDLEVVLRFEAGDLTTEVRDHGRGFDVASFDPGRRPDLERPCGRGLFLIAHLMDELDLRRDGGLAVRAVKRAVLASTEGSSLDARPASQAHSDARQREVLEEIDEGFFSLDWEYRYQSLNEAFERIYGRTREELLGRTMWEAFPATGGTAAGEAVRDAMEFGTPAMLEYVSPTVGRWLELRVYPSASGVSGYLREITERKRKELERDELLEALRGSEARYRELVESANSAIIRWSRDGTLSYFNEYAQRLFGWTAAEALGQHVNILVPLRETTGADLTALAADIVAHPERYVQNVNENVCRDGRRLWLAWTNRAVCDSHGEVVEILAIGNDITERKHAEEALAASEAQLAAELAALSRLHELVLRLLTCPDLQEALDEVLTTTMEITGADAGNIQLRDASDATLETAANRRFPPRPLSRPHEVRAGDGTLCATVMASGQRVICEDLLVGGFAPCRDVAIDTGLRSAHSTPLLTRRGEVLGVLCLHYGAPRPSSTRDVRLLDLCAQQAADVIEHARLCEKEESPPRPQRQPWPNATGGGGLSRR